MLARSGYQGPVCCLQAMVSTAVGLRALSEFLSMEISSTNSSSRALAGNESDFHQLQLSQA
jgi:hypothetical protein